MRDSNAVDMEILPTTMRIHTTNDSNISKKIYFWSHNKIFQFSAIFGLEFCSQFECCR